MSSTLQDAGAESLFGQELQQSKKGGPESSPEESPLNFVCADQECRPDVGMVNHKPICSENMR